MQEAWNTSMGIYLHCLFRIDSEHQVWFGPFLPNTNVQNDHLDLFEYHYLLSWALRFHDDIQMAMPSKKIIHQRTD